MEPRPLTLNSWFILGWLTIKYELLPSIYFMYESFVILLSLSKNFLFQVHVCSYSLFTSLRDMTSELYQRRSRSFLFNAILKLTSPVNGTKVSVRTIYVNFFFRTLPSIFTMAKTFFFLKPYSCFLDFQQHEVTTFGKVIWKWNLFCYWSLAWVIFAAFSLIRSLVKSFVWA